MSEQNWRDLPAGRDLDRLVAEKAGYRVQHDHPDYILWSADGDFVVRQPDEYLAWRHVPHYSTSVDAALALVPGGDIAFELYRDENTGDWWAEFDGWYDEGSPWPALAIVRAWLAWKDGTP